MSTRNEIYTKLRNRGLTPDSARELCVIAESVFQASPSISSFVAASLFRFLSNQWDDAQAVPTAVLQPY